MIISHLYSDKNCKGRDRQLPVNGENWQNILDLSGYESSVSFCFSASV